VPAFAVSGGTANLSGALNVSVSNGCLPLPSQHFQVLTFSSRNGDFSSVTTPYVRTYTSTTLTLSPSAAVCVTRPAVQVRTTPDGTGGLVVSLMETNSGVPIRSVAFGALANAAIDIGSAPRQATSFTYALPTPMQQVTFVVHRVTPGPTTVPLTVMD